MFLKQTQKLRSYWATFHEISKRITIKKLPNLVTLYVSRKVWSCTNEIAISTALGESKNWTKNRKKGKGVNECARDNHVSSFLRWKSPSLPLLPNYLPCTYLCNFMPIYISFSIAPSLPIPVRPYLGTTYLGAS